MIFNVATMLCLYSLHKFATEALSGRLPHGGVEYSGNPHSIPLQRCVQYKGEPTYSRNTQDLTPYVNVPSPPRPSFFQPRIRQPEEAQDWMFPSKRSLRPFLFSVTAIAMATADQAVVDSIAML